MTRDTRITTAAQLLKYMHANYRRNTFSACSQKDYARIALASDNCFHDPKTGLPTEPYPDTPQWILRAFATKARQSSAERRRVNDSWECYFLKHPKRKPTP